MYKKYQKMDDASVDKDLEVVDFRRGLTQAQKDKIIQVDYVSSEVIAAAQKAFKNYGQTPNADTTEPEALPDACTIYEHKDFDSALVDPGVVRVV
jgi:alkylated DNA repair protein alkB family protein 1